MYYNFLSHTDNHVQYMVIGNNWYPGPNNIAGLAGLPRLYFLTGRGMLTYVKVTGDRVLYFAFVFWRLAVIKCNVTLTAETHSITWGNCGRKIFQLRGRLFAAYIYHAYPFPKLNFYITIFVRNLGLKLNYG